MAGKHVEFLGITIPLNDQGHLHGCVCPECPTYDKAKHEMLKKWEEEDGGS